MTRSHPSEVDPTDESSPPRAPGDRSRRHSLLLSIGAWLVCAIVHLFRVTFRWQLIDESGGMAAIDQRGEPHILLAWHNRLVIATPYFVKTIIRRGRPISVLISLSDDGELATRVGLGLGSGVVRGSSSRGGASGLRKLFQILRRDSSSVLLIPDGPRGPLYELKVGALVLSQMTGLPILPVGMAVKSSSRLRSWDRLILPWPGTQAVAIAGRPAVVPRHLTSDELEAERLRIQGELMDLNRRAEAMLGVSDIAAINTNRPG
ncbi:MAG: DUF374 domain-containing protein [Thermoanaerobaculia bacterium]|nr:DUF374 domain-containing protein [Thermoanaerobaculia bacterium]